MGYKQQLKKKRKQQKQTKNTAQQSMEIQTNEPSTSKASQPSVYLPGSSTKSAEEELVYDETSYRMYHQISLEYPCLSFDIVPDGTAREEDVYPLGAYVVSGTQSGQRQDKILVIRLSNLYGIRDKRRKKDDDSDLEEEEESESEDSEDEWETERQPKMIAAMIPHNGAVNRIRYSRVGDTPLTASWSEQGQVSIYSIGDALQAVEDPDLLPRFSEAANKTKPLFTFRGHLTEGFAVDWSPISLGHLATGDCAKNIHVWKPTKSDWVVEQRPYIGHEQSVEDIQWSPNEPTVFASCSVDKSIRVFDIRASPLKACMITVSGAHTSDVNVIHWNRNAPFLVSGGDDGAIKVWDLRLLKSGESVATFKHHTGAITSVAWHPTDSGVFASSSEDNQVALWDMGVEPDDESMEVTEEKSSDLDIPPQLLFMHLGQEEVKEVHWHPEVPGVLMSTALGGLDVFRTISV